MLKELGIEMNNIYYDAKIAAYDLNPTSSHYSIEDIAHQYLGIDCDDYLGQYAIDKKEAKQLNLFQLEEKKKTINIFMDLKHI